jgi:hypothetical protein
MDNANENLQRKMNNNATRRSKSPLGWAIGGAFLVVLLGLLFFYFGFTEQFNDATGSGSTRPNVASESQPGK